MHDANLGFLFSLSQTCKAIMEFLSRVHTIALESLDGTNLEQFLTELGAGVRSLLLEHMKKFQINAAGGLMLTKYIPLTYRKKEKGASS